MAASVPGGRQQAAEPAPSELCAAPTAPPRVDYSSRDLPSAASTHAEPQASAPAADDSPDVPPAMQSPDVIQISSSGSSEGMPAGPAAGTHLPLEDCLKSGGSSRGKRSQPDSGIGAADGVAGGRCRVRRRRVVLDSDTEASASAADGNIRRDSTACAGANQLPAQLDDSQEGNQRTSAWLDLGSDRWSSQLLAAQAGAQTQLATGLEQAQVAGQSVLKNRGHELHAVDAGGSVPAAAQCADADGGAHAAMPMVRLAELVATAASESQTGEMPRRVRATDCSVIRMRVPLRFRDHANAPLNR